MKNIIVTAITIITIITSCKKETDTVNPSVVIEGTMMTYMSPAVTLTKNVEYGINPGKDMYENSFIHKALVIIEPKDGLPDTLTEISYIDPGTGWTTYQYTSFKIKGETGKSYTLKVTTEGKTYSALTTIPQSVKIEEIWYVSDAANESLKTVWIKILDPSGTNYYRYLLDVNGRYVQPEISTFNDIAFDGKEFSKVIAGDVMGYFTVGDTVTVKLGNTEKFYYNVWTSIDSKRSQNQNIFMNSTRTVGNIKGCLGYWSGIGGDKKSIVIK